MSCKLWHSDSEYGYQDAGGSSYHVLRDVTCAASYHQKDQVASSPTGDKSMVLVKRTAQFSFGPSLDLSLTPQALHHLGNVYCHALLVRVRLWLHAPDCAVPHRFTEAAVQQSSKSSQKDAHSVVLCELLLLNFQLQLQ